MKYLLVIMLLAGCDDNCKPGAAACDGEVIQVCDGSEYWEDLIDCDAEFGLKCCPIGDNDFDCLERCE